MALPISFLPPSLGTDKPTNISSYFRVISAIFESFRLNTKDDRFGWFESAFGTERTSQLKADKIKEPVRSQDESLDSFRFRLAGFCFFQLFLQEIFQEFANLIPASFDISRHYWPKRQLP